MYSLGVMVHFVLSTPITPGAPLDSRGLPPIHRPLYLPPPQSLTKAEPKSGVRFALAPAPFEILPLPHLGLCYFGSSGPDALLSRFS